MLSKLLFFGLALTVLAQDLPTNYEYYTGDGISSGLSADQPSFLLNGKNISIFSGAMHYFRVPRPYWRDRLRKIRAAGLNAVESYIPWNLHEFQNGVYDFGNGGSEMEDFLHLEEFLQIAQEEDLFVIIRPGPFICAEYNFGGFPSWLLREKTIGFRTSEETYMKYVKRYFNILLPILEKYQFTQNGPIIIFQIENEYGYSREGDFSPDKVYLKELYDIYQDNNIVELLVTSDGPTASETSGTIPELFFQTGNFNSDPEGNLNKLAELQPGRPVMVMEYWPGWYDKWTDGHHTTSVETVNEIYGAILNYPAPASIYMFHGGTNFYFLNGANMDNAEPDNSGFSPVTTSYDYDAPLNETGGYTPKYDLIKKLVAEHLAVETKIPEQPDIIPPIEYAPAHINKSITLTEAVQKNPVVSSLSSTPIAFEHLPINNNSGQSYGYAIYRKEGVDIPAGGVLTIEGHVCDSVMVLLNGNLISPPLTSSSSLDGFGYWRLKDSSLKLQDKELKNATLELIVEEWGRMNIGSIQVYNKTFKGLWQGKIRINETELLDWEILSVEFKKSWINSLTAWKEVEVREEPTFALLAPTLFQAILTIEDEPRDTFIDLTNWGKGIAIVNGFVIGRYARIGPQQSLYVPGCFLKQGDNEIILFEQFMAHTDVTFTSELKFANN